MKKKMDQLKKHLYSTDGNKRAFAQAGLGIGLAKISGDNMPNIRRQIDGLANILLIEPTVVLAEAIKYRKYAAAIRASKDSCYTFQEALGTADFYSDDYIASVNAEINSFRAGFKYAIALKGRNANDIG